MDDWVACLKVVSEGFLRPCSRGKLEKLVRRQPEFDTARVRVPEGAYALKYIVEESTRGYSFRTADSGLRTPDFGHSKG